MPGGLKVAVQMDPIETINIDGDSTFALMLEAQQRGHALWHYEVRNLSLREGMERGEARVERLTARRAAGAGAARAQRSLQIRRGRPGSISRRWTSC